MVVNGVLYSGSNVTNCSGQTVAAPYSGAWCVSTSSLSIGSYDVVATITNASGYTLQDKTVNELVIGDASLTYSVTYNGNGNNTGTAPTDATAYSFNGTVTVSGNTGTLTKTGVSFGGWNTKADGSGAMYSPGSTFSIGANTTLYAYWTTTLYTVSFTSNSGSAVNSQSVAYGGTAVEPPAPTRSGYSFDGWYNEIGLTSLFNFSTPITANKTLYAKWSANAVTSYTVSFNSNGGSAVTSQTVNNGSPATQPSNPTQTGYTFEGWYSDSGLTTAFSFSTAITGATTLYAKWTANAPSATTGSASSVSQTSATLNGTVNPNGLSTTVTFQRGTTTAYGTSITPVSSPLIASAGSTGVSVNLTGLTCNTTYHFRVVASSSGGTTNGSDQTFTTSACSGGSLSGEVSRKKLNPGYEKVAGITVNLINSSNSTVATTTTDANGAYSFTSVAAGTYSVSFSTPTGARGVKAGSANANASSSTITGLVVTEGAALTGANAVVVDPAGVIYDANTRLPLAGAAVWLYKDNLLVANTQLDTSLGTVNGALTGSDGQYSLVLNGTATTGTYELRVTPPAGYAFQSTLIPASSTNSSSAYTPQLGGRTEAIQTQTTAPTGADPTVYQLWFSFTITSNLATTSNGVIHNHIPLDPQYSVSFNTNGGSAVPSQTINHGSLATQPSNPTRTNYTFAGWFSDSGLTTAFNFSTAITGTTPLYAKWTINSYSVSFNTNGGSAVSVQTINHGSLATQPSNPTQTGYTFAGWFSDSGLTTAFNFSTAITGATTLYAKWTLNSYSVSFNTNGGSVVSSQTINHGSLATQPSNPTQTGYTFAGWFSDSGLTTAFNFSTAITGATTLYAKWTLNSYSVSFNTNGGSVVSSQTINHGSLATQPSNPTQTGYTFAGWFSDSGLTTAFNFSTAITGATTLYAKWTANTPTAITGSASSATVSGVTLAGTVNDNGQNTTVSFDYGLSNTYGMSVNATTGGSINAGSGSMAVSVTLSGLSCGTTYHYRVSATSTGGTVYGSDATFSTSSCSAGTVAMSFQSNGGSAVNSQNVTSGSAPTRPADPTRTGYSFTGWFSDSGLTQAFNFSAPISVSTTAWAGWQINTYSISISVSPTGSGTLVCSPNPVPHGSTVVCTATANANHTLVSFSGACSGNTCSLSNVTSAISVSATFINNLAPQATGVQINGDPQNGLTLTGVYTFSDNEIDPQGTSTFRWLQSNNSQGNNPTVISGVTGLSFTPADQHEGQYIIFCVVPRAISGVLNGAEVCSSPLGPVAPEDIDGVTPTIEGNVPARGNRIQGDGNGDGIPDRLQNHVASLPTTVGNAYATVVSESSKQLSSVSSQPTPNTLPSSLRAPYGALQFNAEGVAPSASEIFTIHLPYDRRIAGAMKFNRFSQQWDMIGTVTHDGTTATAIRFTLQNGGPYDADGDANNNQIRDPIVPVYNTYTVSVTVSGLLPGQTLVLGNNGNDTLTFNGNGSLTFATVLLESDPYNVTALSAPAGSSCTITGGSGTMPAANVNAIIIDCTSATTTAPPTTAHPIPTLSQWGMLLTSLLMIGAGLWMRPRFKTKLSRL